jgi:hypothetical protein
MTDDGLKGDAYTYSSMIDVYSKIRSWSILMEGYFRAEGEEDRNKALSIWKYLSSQQTHKSMGIDLSENDSSVLPDATTLAIELDVCKFGRFEKEAIAVWQYGQDNDEVVLEAHTLLHYVEVLASFGNRKAAGFAVELIQYGVNGWEMSWRNVKPDWRAIGRVCSLGSQK